MKIIKMPEGQPLCLLYASAMVLNADVDEMIKEIGYTGLEAQWPQLITPYCYRSHHIQEIQEYAIRIKKKALVQIEHYPYNAPNDIVKPNLAIRPDDDATHRFMSLIMNRVGLMTGVYKDKPHAWAWDGQSCFDPNGFQRDLSDYKIINDCWLVTDIT